jgi:DNA polymerase III gamma/tau subunit
MIPIILVATSKKAADRYIESLCQRDDILFRIRPEKTEFSIDQVKEIVKEIKISHPKTRVYILEGFDVSSIEAQNAFLKTLEETPPRIRFILVVANLHKLLPTIVSRSKVISLNEKFSHKTNEAVTKSLVTLIESKDLKTMGKADFTVATKAETIDLIDQIIDFFRIRMVNDAKASTVIKKAIEVRKLIENNNLNSQLSIDHLLIFIRNKYLK